MGSSPIASRLAISIGCALTGATPALAQDASDRGAIFIRRGTDTLVVDRYIVERDTTLTPAQRDSILRAARASLDPAKQTIPWVKFWMSHDPAPTARLVKTPTLILQGATDRHVPEDQAVKLAALIRAGGNRDVTVRVFPATNHLFVEDPSGDFYAYDTLRTNRIRRAVLGALADWVVLKPGTAR